MDGWSFPKTLAMTMSYLAKKVEHNLTLSVKLAEKIANVVD
jgi:hypothetical protein